MDTVLWPWQMCLTYKDPASCSHFLVHKQAVNVVYKRSFSQAWKKVSFLARVKSEIHIAETACDFFTMLLFFSAPFETVHPEVQNIVMPKLEKCSMHSSLHSQEVYWGRQLIPPPSHTPLVLAVCCTFQPPWVCQGNGAPFTVDPSIEC